MATRDPAALFLKAFGRTVRARRDALGLSQEDLSFRCALDRTYISGVERGVRNPTVKTMFRLAEALQTSVHGLTEAAQAAFDGSRK